MPTHDDQSLDLLRERLLSIAPPSRKQWFFWIGGIVLAVLLIIATTATFVVTTRIDSKQTPAQYQTLHHDMVKLRKLANQASAQNSSDYAQLRATYLQIEAQVEQLCKSVSGCVWTSTKI